MCIFFPVPGSSARFFEGTFDGDWAEMPGLFINIALRADAFRGCCMLSAMRESRSRITVFLRFVFACPWRIWFAGGERIRRARVGDMLDFRADFSFSSTVFLLHPSYAHISLEIPWRTYTISRMCFSLPVTIGMDFQTFCLVDWLIDWLWTFCLVNQSIKSSVIIAWTYFQSVLLVCWLLDLRELT